MTDDQELLKVKISIADRVYPLTIKPQQEESLRKAAKDIAQLSKKFEEQYEVKDKQDVLAMCALQFAAATEQQSIKKEDETLQFESKLQLWIRKMDEALETRS
jgi:cell division protein ZapA